MFQKLRVEKQTAILRSREGRYLWVSSDEVKAPLHGITLRSALLVVADISVALRTPFAGPDAFLVQDHDGVAVSTRHRVVLDAEATAGAVVDHD